jgi:hypothetical protein
MGMRRVDGEAVMNQCFLTGRQTRRREGRIYQESQTKQNQTVFEEGEGKAEGTLTVDT